MQIHREKYEKEIFSKIHTFSPKIQKKPKNCPLSNKKEDSLKATKKDKHFERLPLHKSNSSVELKKTTFSVGQTSSFIRDPNHLKR